MLKKGNINMPGPDSFALWVEQGDGRPVVSFQAYFWTGKNGIRKVRAVSILRRLTRGTWCCRWCGDDLPDYLRADALYCRESCRKRAARQRRKKTRAL